jgi:hypothetical protein
MVKMMSTTHIKKVHEDFFATTGQHSLLSGFFMKKNVEVIPREPCNLCGQAFTNNFEWLINGNNQILHEDCFMIVLRLDLASNSETQHPPPDQQTV